MSAQCWLHNDFVRAAGKNRGDGCTHLGTMGHKGHHFSLRDLGMNIYSRHEVGDKREHLIQTSRRGVQRGMKGGRGGTRLLEVRPPHIKTTCHQDYLPSGLPAIKTTCHQGYLPSGLPAIRTTCHQDYLPSRLPAIKTTVQPSTPPYKI
ncbi:hypothetical protein FHG87_004956 [Trinorchestia longiramus]|nr:hypothetical protein FHG87_004956 [Trinorchestia longiramus]